MGEAKERGIKNPPDLPAVTSLEKSTRNRGRKKAKHESAMAKRYHEQGVTDDKTNVRITTQIKGKAKANEIKYKKRSDARKKKAAANYRNGAKAYKD